MKPVWNSLLLALNLVILSPGTLIVLAEPTAPGPVRETPAKGATETTKTPTSEEINRQQKLIKADQLYQGKQYAAAEKLYREVKPPFVIEVNTRAQAKPILDPAQLPPGGQVYWRETQAGTAKNLQTQIMVPLQLLVEQYPQFVPGQLRMAEVLQQEKHPKAALDVLERATILYPDQPDLVKAKVTALAAREKWMEASLAARQFALLNSNSPDAPEMQGLADQNLNRYKRHLRAKIRGNAIANIITGALGYAFTGSLFGPVSAIQTTTMLLEGESAIGESAARQARQHMELVKDKAVVDYVNEIGQKLAHVAGRNDFQYEFYVVMDDDLNAFALPGGKVFVNAGAIAHTNSEAELAGLMAHELSHAVLSHGFQLMTEGNLLANATQFVPYGGGIVADLFTLSYSRDMERQADILGTRVLASSGYAADGLRNLMVTLKQQEKSSPPSWLSDHPLTKERISYLENLIEHSGYNRYAYEGVARHAEIKARVEKLLAEKKQHEKKHRHQLNDEF